MDSPISILYLDHAPIWGGAEVVLVTLLHNLDRQQVRPYVATASTSPLAQRLAGSDVTMLPIPFDPLNQAGWRLPFNLMKSIIAVMRLIRQNTIHLIHTNTVRAHIVGSLAGWLTRTPVVWTLHDNTFPPRLVRWLSPIPSQVITVSTWLADLYRPYGLNGRCTVIPNGLPRIAQKEQSPEIRNELNILPQAPLVLNVGRLIAGKAPHIFIHAAEQVAARHPQAHFVLVGGPDDEEAANQAYLSQLTQLITNTSLTAHLHAVGPRQDVGRFYQAADVVVYNAVQPEGLPTVLLEAMAYAKPVIASAIGGALEIVADGQTGILTPPGHVTMLADALDELLSAPSRQKAMGQAGLTRLHEQFSVAQQVKKTIEVYHTALRGS